VKDSGRDNVENVFAAAESYGMTRVVSSLVTGDTIEFIREDVDDFSFSFIAPLQADNGEILLHDSRLSGGTSASPRSMGEQADGLPPKSDGFKVTPALSAEVLVQCLGDDVFSDGADNLFPDLTVFEEKQRGDASNIKP
jgi:hypothetical protein